MFDFKTTWWFLLMQLFSLIIWFAMFTDPIRDVIRIANSGIRVYCNPPLTYLCKRSSKIWNASVVQSILLAGQLLNDQQLPCACEIKVEKTENFPEYPVCKDSLHKYLLSLFPLLWFLQGRQMAWTKYQNHQDRDR